MSKAFPPILVKDQWIHIESILYRKCDPLPEIDFSEVLALGIEPDDLLVNLERQAEGMMGEEGWLYYYTVRSERVSLQVEELLRICRDRYVELKKLRVENNKLRKQIEILTSVG